MFYFHSLDGRMTTRKRLCVFGGRGWRTRTRTLCIWRCIVMSTWSPPNTQSRANAATLRNLHHMCLGSGHSPSPVGRADCMCIHGRPCVWLPFAAACCYILFYLQMMPVARLVCQRPSSNFTYFWTPLANFLLSRPNSVEYGNSKTTTLLYSAKCTRSLFQGRTGCAGRPSGWHDIVTCQRLVYFCSVSVGFVEKKLGFGSK